ncbi:MAG: hypothetical protein M2R45_04025 [Verrucomicrobia subdivision 3 bacterium]|nr:hypothetical protein [Limisphaerales bacterium]MCS1416224.1 hypothetical protein [Limisphaerales bacterium]
MVRSSFLSFSGREGLSPTFIVLLQLPCFGEKIEGDGCSVIDLAC